MKTPFAAAVSAAALSLAGCVSLLYVKANGEPGIESTRDEATGVVTVQPRTATRPGSGYYLYFTIDAAKKKGPLHAVFESWGADWIMPEEVVLSADGKAHAIPLPNEGWTQRIVPGSGSTEVSLAPQCVEKADVLLGEKHADALAALCAAREASAEIVGRAGRTAIVEPIFLADAKAICEALRAP